MTHPPIPPGSPYFETIDGDICFDIHTDCVTLEFKNWQDRARESFFRPIIAAVARCAWLDEYERYHEAFNQVLRIVTEMGLSDEGFDGFVGFALNECERLKLQAADHAEAWREWKHA
jgi:hypothetical protein